MTNILIVADGKVGNVFLEKVATKTLNEFKFLAVLKEKKEFNFKSRNIEFKYIDPTSLYRIKLICLNYQFNTIFIIMDKNSEALEVYKNIREINKKVRIILLDNNKEFDQIEDSYISIIDSLELIANRLYYFLPNVSVTAQIVGLNEGEIMEVLVPFASIYAFRHIGTIPQIKWRIAAIYRNNKLVLPTNGTMVRPGDRLLLVGKPNVLVNVYNRIKNKSVAFPEPYGKNFYLYIDLSRDNEDNVRHIQEAIFILNKFKNKELIIRVINPTNVEAVNRIKKFDKGRVKVHISYRSDIKSILNSDITQYDIGLILVSYKTFKNKRFNKALYEQKKLVYIFGENRLHKVKEAIITKSDNKELEQISTVAFYIAETLKIKLSFANYCPNENCEDRKEIKEHIETLSHVYNYPINIIEGNKNPIIAIRKSKPVLLILPFRPNLKLRSFFVYLFMDTTNLLIRINKHPRLLIPMEDNQA